MVLLCVSMGPLHVASLSGLSSTGSSVESDFLHGASGFPSYKSQELGRSYLMACLPNILGRRWFKDSCVISSSSSDSNQDPPLSEVDTKASRLARLRQYGALGKPHNTEMKS